MQIEKEKNIKLIMSELELRVRSLEFGVGDFLDIGNCYQIFEIKLQTPNSSSLQTPNSSSLLLYLLQHFHQIIPEFGNGRYVYSFVGGVGRANGGAK